MVLMRLLTGSVFRRVSQVKIMWVCLALFFAGVFLMQVAASMPVATAGLILSGAGLAGGFPIMLGFVGERFSEVSGTAFSFVFVVALIGNMLVNFLMGLIVHNYGVAIDDSCVYRRCIDDIVIHIHRASAGCKCDLRF